MPDKVIRESVHRSFLKKADEVLPKFFDKAVQEGERSAIQRFLALLAGTLVGVSANAMTVMKKMKASEVQKARRTERGYVIYISYLINPNGKRFFGDALIPVNSQTYGIMKSWLQAREDIPGWSSEFFFSSNTGGRVNTSLLLAQFKRIWVELGLPPRPPTFIDLHDSIVEHALTSALRLMSEPDPDLVVRMSIYMYYDLAASRWFLKDDEAREKAFQDVKELFQDDLAQEEEEPAQEEVVKEEVAEEEVIKEEAVHEEEEVKWNRRRLRKRAVNQEEVNSQQELVKEEVNSQEVVIKEEVVEEEVIKEDPAQEEVVKEEVVHEEEASNKEEVKWNRRRLRKRAVNQEVNSQQVVIKEEVKWSRRRVMKREFHQEENGEEEEVKNKILRTRVSVLLSPLSPRTMRRWTGRGSHQGTPAGVP
ncbi:uncharacterized protein LOC134464124 [Engraulis encrasicolus]|uniref:uncharacterized protein LOC134464124 n=1 Tax=Engraulis encrasicolus TaxID=184585 RepID=UPI002FD3A2B0